MSKEVSYLIQLLSDHIRGIKSVPRQDLDWDIMTYLAKSHDVIAIVYYQCHDWIPDEKVSLFQNAYYSSLFIYSNRVKLLEEINTRFSEKAISYVTVKGLDIASFYTVPALRTMCDLDIIVNKKE